MLTEDMYKIVSDVLEEYEQNLPYPHNRANAVAHGLHGDQPYVVQLLIYQGLMMIN